MKNCLDSKLQIDSICSTRIHSREQDIFHKPQRFNSNPSELYFREHLVLIPPTPNSVALSRPKS